jgi:hypothetical protein
MTEGWIILKVVCNLVRGFTVCVSAFVTVTTTESQTDWRDGTRRDEVTKSVNKSSLITTVPSIQLQSIPSWFNGSSKQLTCARMWSDWTFLSRTNLAFNSYPIWELIPAGATSCGKYRGNELSNEQLAGNIPNKRLDRSANPQYKGAIRRYISDHVV